MMRGGGQFEKVNRQGEVCDEERRSGRKSQYWQVEGYNEGKRSG